MSFNILKWILLLDFLLSMHIWLEAFIPVLPVNFITISTLLLFVKRNRAKENMTVVKKMLLWIAIYSIFLLVTGNIRYAFSQPFYYIPGILLCMLPAYYLKDIFVFISKAMAYILLISFIVFIIDLIVDLPPVNYVKVGTYNEFENYVFLLKNQSLREFFRFSGPFVESGHMSMICAILLYANQYKFKKWYNIVFLVSILFSLSLAGYVLLGLGLVLYNIKSFKRIIQISVGALLMLYIVADVWDNGNNPVNIFIISRLEYDEEKGITGNNRFDLDTDNYYNKLTTQDFLVGLGLDKYKQLEEEELVAGAGYKIFILINGFIGCLFVLMIYYNFCRLSFNRKYAIGFLLLMIASFLQRAYPTWMAWLLPLICGTVLSNYSDRNKKHIMLA